MQALNSISNMNIACSFHSDRTGHWETLDRQDELKEAKIYSDTHCLCSWLSLLLYFILYDNLQWFKQ